MTDLQQDLAFIKGDKIVLKAQEGFPEREIGEVRENEAESFQYFIDRFDLLKKKVEEVQQQIETEDNKGSFLMKVINLNESLNSYDGIGDFVQLKAQLVNLEKMLEDYIQQNRKRNLEVKTTLIEEAKSYAANPDWREATEQLKELKQRWIRVGAVEDDKKVETEESFQAVFDEFYEKKKNFHEAKTLMMEARIKQYESLIEKAKIAQANSEGVNELINEWKSLENIPKEKYATLLRSFKKYTNQVKVQPKTQIKGKAADGNVVENEKLKSALLAELKEIKAALPNQSKEAIDKAKEIQQKWKKIGKVLNRTINEEYFFLNDYIFEYHFLESLFQKKVSRDTKEPEAIKFKMNLLRDLIQRDQRELNIFEENMEKFSLGTQKLDKLVGFKHEKQKRKLKVKQQIMLELRDLSKNLK